MKGAYQQITDKIVEELETGVRPWFKPWSTGHAAERVTRPLRSNGTPYRGVNILMLWAAALARGFDCATWMTFRQAKELGAFVRKGEQGSLVVYADKITRKEADSRTGAEEERTIPFMKGYTVFNVAQIEGLPTHFYAAPTAPQGTPIERVAEYETFFAATKATIRHGGTMAFYNVSQDAVQMPPLECFKDAPSYYATLAHEMTHWTRHKSRLDREFGRKRFGDQGYAMEELVAELGSAFLGADLKLTPDIRDDHAAYIGSWIKVLKNDSRAVFTAAAHAQRAADFLHGFQAKEAEAA
jgi:antirestriction protein ArdC